MNFSPLYIDTSALIKWYLPEPFSEEFEDFIRARPGAHISSLTVTELRCTLARYQRNRELNAKAHTEIVATFSAQISAGYLHQLPVKDEYFSHVSELLDTTKQPLRTLDALHLAIAHATGCKEFATADRIQAAAAKTLGFALHTFY